MNVITMSFLWWLVFARNSVMSETGAKMQFDYKSFVFQEFHLHSCIRTTLNVFKNYGHICISKNDVHIFTVMFIHLTSLRVQEYEK